MNKFLANLNPRERRLVLGGGGALLALLIFALGWLPFSREVTRLQDIVGEQRALAAWMEQAAKEAQRLRSLSAGAANSRSGLSLLALTDQTARQAGLGNAIKRVEPEGQDKVHIRLEGAAFDDLTAWLEKLQLSQQIRIVSITIDRQELPGLVDARLTLEESGS